MANILRFTRRAAGPRRPRRPAGADPRKLLALVCVASLLGVAVPEWRTAISAVASLVRSPGIAAAGLASAAPSAAAPDVSGRVVRVVDGDSLRLDCCGPDVRLWGIDAPEWNAPGGPAATAALRRIAAGRSLACRGRDTDRYGRIVGQCALADGTDLGRRLLATGTVSEYCRFSRNHYGTC